MKMIIDLENESLKNLLSVQEVIANHIREKEKRGLKGLDYYLFKKYRAYLITAIMEMGNQYQDCEDGSLKKKEKKYKMYVDSLSLLSEFAKKLKEDNVFEVRECVYEAAIESLIKEDIDYYEACGAFYMEKKEKSDKVMYKITF